MCCIQVGEVAIPFGESERVMRLIDIVADLKTYDEELTIYAKEPWSCDSEAVLAREPDAVEPPPEAAAIGAVYFIEVFVANEFLDGWRANQQRSVTTKEQCERLIQYAINDA
jgi:hypothetical protein